MYQYFFISTLPFQVFRDLLDSRHLKCHLVEYYHKTAHKVHLHSMHMSDSLNVLILINLPFEKFLYALLYCTVVTAFKLSYYSILRAFRINFKGVYNLLNTSYATNSYNYYLDKHQV